MNDGSGITLGTPFAYFDRDTSSWKTCQASLLSMMEEQSTESCPTFPRHFMSSRGRCFRLPPLERRTAANESGLWPTPMATDGEKGGPNQRHGSGNQPLPGVAANLWPTPVKSDADAGAIPKTDEFTLKSGRLRARSNNGTDGSLGLAREASLWPTPTLHDHKSASPAEFTRHTPSLMAEAAFLTTPTAHDSTGQKVKFKQGGTPPSAQAASSSPSPSATTGEIPSWYGEGQLNPAFVYWLQGLLDEYQNFAQSETPSASPSPNTSDTAC